MINIKDKKGMLIIDGKSIQLRSFIFDNKCEFCENNYCTKTLDIGCKEFVQNCKEYQILKSKYNILKFEYNKLIDELNK